MPERCSRCRSCNGIGLSSSSTRTARSERSFTRQRSSAPRSIRETSRRRSRAIVGIRCSPRCRRSCSRTRRSLASVCGIPRAHCSSRPIPPRTRATRARTSRSGARPAARCRVGWRSSRSPLHLPKMRLAEPLRSPRPSRRFGSAARPTWWGRSRWSSSRRRSRSGRTSHGGSCRPARPA